MCTTEVKGDVYWQFTPIDSIQFLQILYTMRKINLYQQAAKDHPVKRLLSRNGVVGSTNSSYVATFY